MNSELLRQYTGVTAFLGHVLGPNYEVALFDKIDDDFSLVAIANNELTGREIGTPLSDVLQKVIAEKQYKRSNYLLHYRSYSVNGKLFRSSTYFIKDRDDELLGLLCLSFNDERYKQVSEMILSLCHPDAFVETNFQYNKQHLERIDATEAEAYNQEIIGDINNIPECIRRIITMMGADRKKLTISQKQTIVAKLKQMNVFLRRGAVQEVAAELNCSQATLYRYLAKADDCKL